MDLKFLFLDDVEETTNIGIITWYACYYFYDGEDFFTVTRGEFDKWVAAPHTYEPDFKDMLEQHIKAITNAGKVPEFHTLDQLPEELQAYFNPIKIAKMRVKNEN